MKRFPVIKIPLCLSVLGCFFLLTAGGCTDDSGPFMEKSEEKDVNFVLRIPAPDLPVSRSMDRLQEIEVKDVIVLAITIDASQHEWFACYKAPAAVTMSAGSPYTAEFRVALDSDTDYNLAILANPGESLKAQLASFSATDSKAAVLEVLKYALPAGTGKWPADGSGTYTPVPMYGESGKITIQPEMTVEHIVLTRMLARIDVSVDLGNNPVHTFRLSAVHLCNYNTVGYIAPGTVAPHVPGSPGKQEGSALALRYPVTGATTSTAAYTGEIYTFEAARAAENSLSTSPCLIIEGYFDGETSPCFYRVDFVYDGNPAGSGGTAGTYMPLLRNTLYQVKVTAANRAGYKTLEEALNSYGVNTNDRLKYQTISYNPGDISDMVFDEQYMLGTNAQSGYFDLNPAGETGRTFVIYTNYPTGYEVLTSPSWISAITGSTGAGTQTFTLTAGQNTGATREGELILAAGRLRYTVFFRQ